MTLIEFLNEIFILFPPAKESKEAMYERYYKALLDEHNYDYDSALNEIVMQYTFKTTPPCARLNEIRKQFKITKPKAPNTNDGKKIKLKKGGQIYEFEVVGWADKTIDDYKNQGAVQIGNFYDY